MWPLMKNYHWMSTTSGELFENFGDVVKDIRDIINGGQFPPEYIWKYVTGWKFSRKGF